MIHHFIQYRTYFINSCIFCFCVWINSCIFFFWYKRGL